MALIEQAPQTLWGLWTREGMLKELRMEEVKLANNDLLDYVRHVELRRVGLQRDRLSARGLNDLMDELEHVSTKLFEVPLQPRLRNEAMHVISDVAGRIADTLDWMLQAKAKYLSADIDDMEARHARKLVDAQRKKTIFTRLVRNSLQARRAYVMDPDARETRDRFLLGMKLAMQQCEDLWDQAKRLGQYSGKRMTDPEVVRTFAQALRAYDRVLLSLAGTATERLPKSRQNELLSFTGRYLSEMQHFYESMPRNVQERLGPSVIERAAEVAAQPPLKALRLSERDQKLLDAMNAIQKMLTEGE